MKVWVIVDKKGKPVKYDYKRYRVYYAKNSAIKGCDPFGYDKVKQMELK